MDVVVKLRELAWLAKRDLDDTRYDVLTEAADEIERLRSSLHQREVRIEILERKLREK